ncbi:protein lin-52 homolog isoform X2 [Euwallacea fornicatus]|uniref:protein lin-52 homolog isoform X2 n=1 Tax=Euwallacea fornicatus TaxID=995702 RepID=UPI00338F4B6D
MIFIKNKDFTHKTYLKNYELNVNVLHYSNLNRSGLVNLDFRRVCAVRLGWHYCKMASEKPGLIEQEEGEQNLEEFANSLIAMENMDRTSPEMWPEKVPGVTDFINSYSNTHIPPKMPYSKELTEEDRNHMHQSNSSRTSCTTYCWFYWKS